MIQILSFERYGGITPDFIREEIYPIETADNVILSKMFVAEPRKPAWDPYMRQSTVPTVKFTDEVKSYWKAQDDAIYNGVTVEWFGRCIKVIPTAAISDGYCIAEFRDVD